MQVEWSTLAASDRENIFSYIESDSPQNAVLVDKRIRSQLLTLSRFPECGRPGRIEGTRELMIDKTPFIVAYAIEGEIVIILRVLHASQQWPDSLTDEESF